MFVAEVQRHAGVGDDLDRSPGWQWTVGVHDIAQGDALDVLHDDVGQRAGGRFGLAGVVNRHDGRVTQRRGVLCLAAEPQVEAGIAGQIGAQHFDRDVAVQAVVAGQVDLGHPPEADDLAEFVAVGQALRGAHCSVSCQAGDARGGVSGSLGPLN